MTTITARIRRRDGSLCVFLRTGTKKSWNSAQVADERGRNSRRPDARPLTEEELKRVRRVARG